MTQKTSFSFEIYFAESSAPASAPDDVMKTLGPTLQGLFAEKDGTATVLVSDSHKGSSNRIVEITTTLQDAQLAEILKAFGDARGLTISALE